MNSEVFSGFLKSAINQNKNKNAVDLKMQVE
jgi:hypothetical protein